MNSERYEEQAGACLEAATRHRERLLAVAVKLAGSAEAGMDLFQQTCLDCHDTIQRRGFQGDRYEFYLLTSLKNLYYKQARQPRFEPLGDEMEHLGQAEEAQPAAKLRPGALGVLAEVQAESYVQLAEQVQTKIRELFEPADRLAFRLHLEGHSCQDIADLIGRQDRTWVWRRLSRMKTTLRKTFQQAWDTLWD